MEKTDLGYILAFMQELLRIPSVGGDTAAVMARVRTEFEALGVPVSETKKGALYGTLRGQDDGAQVLVNAHVDTLGAVVREVCANGRLRTSNVGGFTWNAYEGENLTVHTVDGREYSGTMMFEKPSVHIFPVEARETARTEDNMETRLDEDVSCPADVEKLGVAVGDFVSFEPRTVITPNGFIKSRYLDDKACVAVMFGVLKLLAEKHIVPTHTAHFYAANYEEIGHGVSYIPEKTAEMLSLDIGPVGAGRNSNEHCVTICAKDSRTPYDFAFRARLEKLARENNIGFRVDVHNRYGSDASMSVVRGADVNFACIGPGVDATHHYERTHEDALKNCADLLFAYLTE